MMVSSAPSSRARASFSSEELVMSTRAPWALANWRAKMLTPPVPRRRTVCPAWRLPRSTRAFQAVRAEQGEGGGFRVGKACGCVDQA